MAVGQNAIISALSYLAVGRETTFKTYSTCTASLPFISASIKTIQENKILEQIETSRTYSKRISMMKKIEGEAEFYAYPESTSMVYMLQNALGGAISTTEVTAAASYTHEILVGNLEATHTSLCLNHRKGDSASAMVFEYSGVRVNELTFNAEMDDALKCSASFMAVESTSTSNDVASAMTCAAYNPLSFVNGRLSVESTLASLTSTSFWHVQSVELGVANSLKSDAASGRIGSAVLDVLPQGIATFTFNATIRFDTTTAYDAMLAESKFSAEFEFLGDTLTGSSVRRGLTLEMPEVYISDAGDPEIGGADEVLTSEVVFHVLRDCSSATGYALKATVTNGVSTY